MRNVRIENEQGFSSIPTDDDTNGIEKNLNESLSFFIADNDPGCTCGLVLLVKQTL